MNVVLYQPDIALNLGATIRLAACLGVRLHIVEPCGFPFDKKKLKQAALDYIDKVEIIRHVNWDAFLVSERSEAAKFYLLSTKAKKYYYEQNFNQDDYLIFGSESSGVKQEVWENIDDGLKIPLKQDCRSLNLVTSIAITLGEALKQTNYDSVT